MKKVVSRPKRGKPADKEEVHDPTKGLPKLLRIKDVARFLRVSETTVVKWSRQGKLKTIRVYPQGNRRFLMKDVIKLVRVDPGSS